MTKMIAKKTPLKKPKKARELGVTQRLLDLKIQDVKGDISSLRLETKAGFASVDTRFAKMDTRFAQIDARFSQMDAKFEVMQTQITKMLVLLEEQNIRNNVALDGYTAVYEKFQEYSHRFDKMEKHIFGIKQN